MSKNILEKRWNGTEWEEIHPVTKASNVYDSNGNTLQEHITNTGTNHGMATTTKDGFVKLATENEINGNDNTTALTPKSAKSLFLKDTYELKYTPIIHINHENNPDARFIGNWNAFKTNTGKILIGGTPTSPYSEDKISLMTSIDNGYTFDMKTVAQVSTPYASTINSHVSYRYIRVSRQDTDNSIITDFNTRLQSEKCFLKSIDDGSTWTKINPFSGFTLQDELVISSFITSNGTYLSSYGFMGGFVVTPPLRIARSIDKGNSWSITATIDNSNEGKTGITYGHYFKEINNVIFVYLRGNMVNPFVIYRSVDDGITWTRISQLVDTQILSSSAFDAALPFKNTINNDLFSKYDNGTEMIYLKSINNGSSWTSVTKQQYDEECILEVPEDQRFGDGTSLHFQAIDDGELEKGIYVRDINYNIIGKLSSEPIEFPYSEHVKIDDNELIYFNGDNSTLRVTRKNNFF